MLLWISISCFLAHTDNFFSYDSPLQLDTTKTSDNKSTFLHVVAKAVNTDMPEALTFRNEIPSVERANKISLLTLGEVMTELEQKLQVCRHDRNCC